MSEVIKVIGAREHNLKNINVEIPRDKLVVITGVSGSGKSSLAFDTIYAEGQRRYVESLSSYARQFLGIMEKPDVDYIEGLSPAISIDQKSTSRNPRSTVATVTEIYDYLRLLFARIGVPFYSVESRNHAAVNSAIECNNYFDKIGLFPVNIKPNTLIDQLHKEGSYEPTSRWDIVSVLSKLDPKILEKIFLAYYGNKGPDVNIKPTDCFDCHDELENFFDNFIKESDGNKRKEMVSDLINQHHCKCQIK